MAIALFIAGQTCFRNHWMKQTRLKVREALENVHRDALTVAVLRCGAKLLRVKWWTEDPPSAAENGIRADRCDRVKHCLVCLNGCPEWKRCPIVNRLLESGDRKLLPADGALKVKSCVFTRNGTTYLVLDDYGKKEMLPLVDAVKFSTDGHTTVVAQLPPRNNSQDTSDDPDGVAEEPGNPLGNVETAAHAANSTTIDFGKATAK